MPRKKHKDNPKPGDAEAEARAAEILGRVRKMEVRTSRLVDDAMAGRYASVFKGRGMDFDRVRDYVPGDDVRTIDWNVTARTGSPHIKLFTEERELTIMLMIDISASSNFGSVEQTKRELATEAAGVLAASAIRNQDKVGLVLFTDRVELYIPPAKGRIHIMRLIREALFFEPEGSGTDMKVALDFVNQMIKRRSVVFLVSDFSFTGNFDDELNETRRKLQVTNKHHDVIALSVNDPREYSLPEVGILTVQDAETGELVEINTGNAKIRSNYEKQAAARKESVQKSIRSLGVDLLEFENGTDWMPELMKFFENRRHRAA
ncbi:MAG: DUF58 domain-containing protein [Verrucomicrobiales bacterium]|nr:DUF58 domain-containing protein [Verrucomicrobiales bacterium]